MRKLKDGETFWNVVEKYPYFVIATDSSTTNLGYPSPYFTTKKEAEQHAEEVLKMHGVEKAFAWHWEDRF